MIGFNSPVDVTSNLFFIYHSRFMEILLLRVGVRHVELILLPMELASGGSR